MKIFTGLYDRVLSWSKHDKAPHLLCGLSFAESSFFPVPVDVMLAPMALGQPSKAWRFAFLTTLFSVLGGIFGYLIGYFSIETIGPWLIEHGYGGTLDRAKDWFSRFGVWAVLAAGFSPIPYKLFTITAGALGLFFPAFLIASIIGRGARFFLVAGLMRAGGEDAEAKLRKHVETLGWIVVALLVAAVWYLSRH